MALPANNTEWPPKPFDISFADIAEWHIWWEGTSSKLSNYFTTVDASGRASFTSRVADAWSAFTNNRNTNGYTTRRLHLPVAADIARLNATMVFAHPPRIVEAQEEVIPQPPKPEPPALPPAFGGPPAEPKPEPTDVEAQANAIKAAAGVTDEAPAEEQEIKVEVSPAQQRLDELVNDPRFHAELMVGAEGCSALGGTFMRVVWDKEVRDDRPWIDFVDADRALPEYVWGHLVAVTFWNNLGPTERDAKDVVYRHLQRYEKGKIQHALYRGSGDNIGIVVPLNDHPGTIGLMGEEDPDTLELVGGVDAYGYIDTGSDKLAAVYVPNKRPNPSYRHDDQLKMLGYSDFSKDVLPIFAAIDEVWSSLMRDVRQGQGRMVISENLLDLMGPGKGSGFDPNREFFAPVGESIDAEGKPVIEHFQFEIRDGAHGAIINMLLKEALRRVGMSPITFGLVEVAATTATEVRAWSRDTEDTTTAKRRHWGPALQDIVTVLMEIDQAEFSGPGIEDPVEIEWPDTIQLSDLEKAQTLQALEAAGAMSQREKVAYFHDDWDDARIDAEVALIKDDAKASAPPVPDMFGGGESSFGDSGDDEKKQDEGKGTPPVKDAGANPFAK